MREGSQLVCLKGQNKIFLFFLSLWMETNTYKTNKTSYVTSLLCLKSMASQLTPKKAQILTLECNLFLSALTSHHSPCCYLYMFLPKGFCLCFFLEFLSHSHRHGSLSPPLSLLMHHLSIPSLPTLFEIVPLIPPYYSPNILPNLFVYSLSLHQTVNFMRQRYFIFTYYCTQDLGRVFGIS